MLLNIENTFKYNPQLYNKIRLKPSPGDMTNNSKKASTTLYCIKNVDLYKMLRVVTEFPSTDVPLCKVVDNLNMN